LADLEATFGSFFLVAVCYLDINGIDIFCGAELRLVLRSRNARYLIAEGLGFLELAVPSLCGW